MGKALFGELSCTWIGLVFFCCFFLKKTSQLAKSEEQYHIFPAIRRGFRPSRMTSNNLISPMKFCYNTNSTLPKQCQSSRSVLQDGSRTFGLFWKEKKKRLITEEIRYL